jgi:hypothetical protein
LWVAIALAALMGSGLAACSARSSGHGGDTASPITPASPPAVIPPTAIVGETHGATEPISSTPTSQPPKTSPTDLIRQMIDQVSRDRAVKDLRRLAGEEPICTNSGCYTAANRLTGSEGLRWAMDYIQEELVGLGYSVEYKAWSREGWRDQNLVARKVGVVAPRDEVYFVAHVDGVQKGADERFAAADDNASGAADILEVARVLSTFSFSQTVVLLFTTGEEQGSLGSRSYVEQLSKKEVEAIKAVVDVDMVGYDANSDGVMELWHGDDPPSMALTQMMSETIRMVQLDLAPQVVAGCG